MSERADLAARLRRVAAGLDEFVEERYPGGRFPWGAPLDRGNARARRRLTRLVEAVERLAVRIEDEAGPRWWARWRVRWAFRAVERADRRIGRA